MKIAMVSPYDFTWPGGVTIHVSQLARQLHQRGHQIHILAPHSPARDCPDQDLLIPLGRSIPLPSGGSIARISLSWWLARRIRALLQREQYDIIHLHEPMAPILPLTVLEYSNTINIGTFHACHNRQHLYRMSRPVIQRWRRRLHGCIAVSRAAQRYVQRTFPGHYEIIPNGIDVNHFSRQTPPWPQYQDGKTNIIFVGRLEKRKGLRYLLEAYGRLKWDLPQLRLIIVGPGAPDQDSYHLLSSQNLQDVEFTGPVPYQDLPRYYASADIFCSPATGAESFGIVLLEAMAAGKPIIASDIEGYRGLIRHGREGLLFQNKNLESLTHHLKTLIHDPQQRREIGRRGQTAAQRYHWPQVAHQIEQYYESRQHHPPPNHQPCQ